MPIAATILVQSIAQVNLRGSSGRLSNSGDTLSPGPAGRGAKKFPSKPVNKTSVGAEARWTSDEVVAGG